MILICKLENVKDEQQTKLLLLRIKPPISQFTEKSTRA
jgi:hypothetical protein